MSTLSRTLGNLRKIGLKVTRSRPPIGLAPPLTQPLYRNTGTNSKYVRLSPSICSQLPDDD